MLIRYTHSALVDSTRVFCKYYIQTKRNVIVSPFAVPLPMPTSTRGQFKREAGSSKRLLPLERDTT